ncbi:MAG: cation:proton antiporter [Chloroflexi bacterium]|nr:cation:proton antiporter [Chloroflexota bacterium]
MAEAILGIALLILAAKVLEEVATRLRQPPLVGDVLAGLLLGPAVFNTVEPTDEIQLFITIGIFFFFFLVGLEEIDVSGFLANLRTHLFFASVPAFFLPFGLVYLVTVLFDFTWVQSLAVSSLIAISSLSVLAKVLSDIGRLRDHTGLQLFTVTVIIEMIGLVLVSVAIQAGEPGEGFQAADFLWLLLRMVGFLVVAWFVGQRLVPPLLRLVIRYTKAQEIPFGVLMGILLLFVYFGDESGVHGTIGALLLGVALSKSIHEFHFPIVRGFRNLAYGVFVPIFFAGVGLRFEFSFLELSIAAIVSFVAVAFVGKYLGGLVAARLMRLESPPTSATGLMAKGSLEVALLLSLLQVGILQERYYSLLVFIILAFILVMPILVNQVFARSTHHVDVEKSDTIIPAYTQAAMAETRAADVMAEARFTIPHSLTITEFVARHLLYGQSHYPVVDSHGRLVGVMPADRVNLVQKASWPYYVVGRIMDKRVEVAYPEDSLYSVVEKMVRHHLPLVPVVDTAQRRKVLGLVTRDDIITSLVVEEPTNASRPTVRRSE